ncbi:MAG: hypothetical protein JWN48_4729 [Myxococcaceae bacterium]|nr:hypothetical protein [Myxococcaceae bacterium]
MSLRKLVAKGLVWTSLESFGLSGLSLICLVVFARCLSPEEFGVAAVAIAIVQGVSVPTELLFNDVLIQRKQVDPIHINSAFTVTVLLGVVSCAGCWLLSGPIERIVGTPQVGEVLRWMSLSLLGTGFASVLTAVQRRRLEFRAIALRSLVGRAGSAVVALALALGGAGVWALVVQQVLLVWLGTATLWWLTKNDRPRFEFAWLPTRDLLAFAWISTLYHQLGVLLPRVFMVLVGSYLGPTDAGFLSLAFRGVDMLRDLLTGAVAHLAAPVFARLRDDPAALSDGYARSIQLTALVTYPVFIGLATCAYEVVLLVFGAEWLAVTPYFSLVALLTVPHFLWLYAPAVFNTLDKPSAPLVQLVLESSYVVLGMLTFGKLSLDHALGVWASRAVVALPVGMWMLKRISGMGYGQQLTGARIPLLASLGMGSAVLAFKHLLLEWLPPTLRLAAIIAVGAAAYLGMLWWVGRDLLKEFAGFVQQSLRARSSQG